MERIKARKEVTRKLNEDYKMMIFLGILCVLIIVNKPDYLEE